MSPTRWVLRGVLVVLVLVLAFVCYRIWISRQPSYHWNNAQAAIEKKDFDSAKIHLKNLLRRHPDHAQAHELMSETILDAARANNESTRAAANPEAVFHLAEAARLMPEDNNVQRRALSAFLVTQNYGKAADIAEKVHAADPRNGDAHFALLWRAVHHENRREAEELLQQSGSIQSRHFFQTHALEAKFFADQGDNDEARRVIDKAAKIAVQLKPEQLELLTARDRETMLTMLLARQNEATSAADALDAAQTVLEVCELLSKGNLVSPAALANSSARAVAMVHAKYPPSTVDPGLAPRFDALRKMAGKFGAEVIDTNAKEGDDSSANTPPLVYWEYAQNKFEEGKNDEGLNILKQGIATAEKNRTRYGDQYLDLHLLAARRLIMLRRFDEADKHLQILLSNERTSPWGNLLAGSVALHEGKLENAHEHYLKAQQLAGKGVLIDMALAHTFMAQQQWDQALPILISLSELNFDELTEEERAWARQLLGSGERIHFDLLRARLAKDQWEEATEHLKALRGSDFETNAWGMAVAWLWSDGQEDKAKDLLGRVRGRFQDNLPLALLDARLSDQKGDTAGAAKLLEEFAAADSDDMRRQLALCRWKISKRQFQEALQQLGQLEQREDQPDNIRNAILIFKAQALLGSGRRAHAQEILDQLAADPQTRAASMLLKAAGDMQKGDELAAMNALQEASDAAPRSGSLNLAFARLAGSRGKLAEAIDKAANSLDVSALRDQARRLITAAVTQLAEIEGNEKAEKKLDEILKNHPDDVVLLQLRSNFRFQNGRFDEGLADLNRAERLDNQRPEIPYLKGQAWLVHRKNAEEALRELRRAQQLAPKSVPILIMAARASVQAEQYDDAASYAADARKENPTNMQAYFLEAEALSLADRHNEAISLLQVLVDRRPDDFAAVSSLAQAQQKAGRSADALLTIRRGRRAKPDDFRFLVTELDLMLKSEEEGAIEKAMELARQVASDTRFASKLILVAQAFASNDVLDEAVYWGDQALSTARDNEKAGVHMFLGKICLRLGEVDESQWENARGHFEAVLKTQPKNIVAGNNLAWLLCEKFDKSPDAVKVVEQVRGDTPIGQLPVAFVDTMALSYRLASQPKKAYDILNEARASHPEDPQLLFQLGMTLANMQQAAAARNALQQAIELGLPDEQADEAKSKLKTLR